MIASRKGTHVYIELVYSRLRPRPRAVVGLAIEAGTLTLAWLLLRYGLQLVSNNRDVETVTLFFDYAVVYAIVPVAGLAIAATAIADVVAHLPRADAAGDRRMIATMWLILAVWFVVIFLGPPIYLADGARRVRVPLRGRHPGSSSRRRSRWRRTRSRCWRRRCSS